MADKKTGRKHLKQVPKAAVAGDKKRRMTHPSYPKVQDSGRAAALTDSQVLTLATALLGGTGNVYEQCRCRFRVEVGEEVFDRLHSVAKVCRCELCSVWKLADKGNVSVTPEDGVGFVCNACMNGDDSAEDE